MIYTITLKHEGGQTMVAVEAANMDEAMKKVEGMGTITRIEESYLDKLIK